MLELWVEVGVYCGLYVDGVGVFVEKVCESVVYYFLFVGEVEIYGVSFFWYWFDWFCVVIFLVWN